MTIHFDHKVTETDNGHESEPRPDTAMPETPAALESAQLLPSQRTNEDEQSFPSTEPVNANSDNNGQTEANPAQEVTGKNKKSLVAVVGSALAATAVIAGAVSASGPNEIEGTPTIDYEALYNHNNGVNQPSNGIDLENNTAVIEQPTQPDATTNQPTESEVVTPTTDTPNTEQEPNSTNTKDNDESDNFTTFSVEDYKDIDKLATDFIEKGLGEWWQQGTSIEDVANLINDLDHTLLDASLEYASKHADERANNLYVSNWRDNPNLLYDYDQNVKNNYATIYEVALTKNSFNAGDPEDLVKNYGYEGPYYELYIQAHDPHIIDNSDSVRKAYIEFDMTDNTSETRLTTLENPPEPTNIHGGVTVTWVTENVDNDTVWKVSDIIWK